MAVPYGWYYEIKGRSGLGFSGVQPFIGTLDATYNGFLRVLLFNLSNKDYQVNKGDRIAQILFHKQIEMISKEVTQFSPEYDKRGKSGFGSSGK
jgi:dUTP pyrophosphatase